MLICCNITEYIYNFTMVFLYTNAKQDNMKVLYKTVFICFFLLVGTNIFAQYPTYNSRYSAPRYAKYTSYESPVIFGVRAGALISTISSVEQNGVIPGFKGGLTVDFRLQDPIYIQTGLDFSMKGSRGKSNGRYHLNYLSLPIHLAYKPQIQASNYSRFVVYGGGYFAYGVGGSTTLFKVSQVGKIEEGSFDKGMFKKFDAGISLGIGFEVNHVVLTVGSEIGLVNISDLGGESSSTPGEVVGNKGSGYFKDNCKTLTFFATVGYQF